MQISPDNSSILMIINWIQNTYNTYHIYRTRIHGSKPHIFFSLQFNAKNVGPFDFYLVFIKYFSSFPFVSPKDQMTNTTVFSPLNQIYRLSKYQKKCPNCFILLYTYSLGEYNSLAWIVPAHDLYLFHLIFQCEKKPKKLKKTKPNLHLWHCTFNEIWTEC